MSERRNSDPGSPPLHLRTPSPTGRRAQGSVSPLPGKKGDASPLPAKKVESSPTLSSEERERKMAAIRAKVAEKKALGVSGAAGAKMQLAPGSATAAPEAVDEAAAPTEGVQLPPQVMPRAERRQAPRTLQRARSGGELIARRAEPVTVTRVVRVGSAEPQAVVTKTSSPTSPRTGSPISPARPARARTGDVGDDSRQRLRMQPRAASDAGQMLTAFRESNAR